MVKDIKTICIIISLYLIIDKSTIIVLLNVILVNILYVLAGMLLLILLSNFDHSKKHC